MKSKSPDAVAILTEQRRHQLRLHKKWMTWWIPLIFVVGLGVSILGLLPSIEISLARGSPTGLLFVFALATLFFGWAVVLWLIGPLLVKPRVVPYFARELEKYGGPTMIAFRRGRALYREIVVLEELATTLGVTPLSQFGFAYDYYEQVVRWHPAVEGLRTVEALRQNLDSRPGLARDVADDLDGLASVLRVAVDRGVAFSLVLRLHAKDSMQMVCTREVRQGSFW
jgi:hypothetical protein